MVITTKTLSGGICKPQAKYPYGGPVYGEDEISAMHRVIASGRFWGGEETLKFEEEISKYLGVKSSTLVNSGSSALLLAFSALEKDLTGGGKFLTQSLTFPTNVSSPLLVGGRRPVFLDVDVDTLNVNPRSVVRALKDSDIKTFTLTHTIGNCTQMDHLDEGLQSMEVPWVEDACLVANTIVPRVGQPNIKIKDVKRGDVVLAYDRGKIVETIVVEISKRLVGEDEVLTLEHSTGIVRCTKNHPFLVDGEFRSAGSLKVGDKLYKLPWGEYLNARRNWSITKLGRSKLSSRMRKNNPMKKQSVVIKSMLGHKYGPSNIEKSLIRLIGEENLPITYVGDNQFIIDGKCPDFIVDGTKKIIEVYSPTFLYGDRLRDEDWVTSRREHFTKNGYTCHFLPLDRCVTKNTREYTLQLLRNVIYNGSEILKIINSSSRRQQHIKALNGSNENTPKGFVWVYNLKCEPYNNYVLLGGIISHNCDTLGSSWNGRKLGSYGSISCCSLHPAHQITGGLGGFCSTDDEVLGERLHSMRDWGRGALGGERFVTETDSLTTFSRRIDKQYQYTQRGFNFQLPEVNAAMARVQLRRIDEFNLRRMRNWSMINEWIIDHWQKLLIPPKVHREASISWFGFPLIFKTNALGSIHRFELMKEMEVNGVETRSLYGGPVNETEAYNGVQHDVYGGLSNSRYLHENAFWVSVWHGLGEEEMGSMIFEMDKVLKKWFNAKRS